jgi:hypothetical protein
MIAVEATFLALATSLAVARGVYLHSGGAPPLPPRPQHPHASRAWPLFLAASVCLCTAVSTALAVPFFWFAATLLSVGVQGSPGPCLFLIGVVWGAPVAAMLLPTAAAAAAGAAAAAVQERQLAVFGTVAQQPEAEGAPPLCRAPPMLIFVFLKPATAANKRSTITST